MDELINQDSRRVLAYYQQLMMTAKTEGDMRLHENCVKITRELSKQIKEKSSLLVTDCTFKLNIPEPYFNRMSNGGQS